MSSSGTAPLTGLEFNTGGMVPKGNLKMMSDDPFAELDNSH